MHSLGLSSNIMSLGGIAIAIGAMVDAAIVMIENAHKHLERAPPGKPRGEVLIEAAIEVGPALFFSLLIITVSFLPIFALEAQEGRMFKPLAFTKTFAMAAAALLSVTLVPALMLLFVRGRMVPEQRNPVNRFLMWIYRPVIRTALRFKAATIVVALVILAGSMWPASRLGTEFMPTINEGTLFYMPTTLPGLSVTKAAELVQTQNKIIKTFPEVASVWGKAGRATTATDPAPTEMFETIINLKPETEWRHGMTVDRLIAEMDKALQFPGVSNAWTMPIKARIDMLATGIRTPVGVKVYGTDLAGMEQVARQVEAAIRTVPGTTSAFAERIIGGYYLNVEPDRAQLARYGLMITDVQDVIATALGAEAGHHHGRGPRALHGQHPLPARPAQRSPVDRHPGAHPADQRRNGAARRSRQDGALRAPPRSAPRTRKLRCLHLRRLRGRDLGGYVADARRRSPPGRFPPGYYATWSGQFEYMERAKARLKIVVPVTVLIIFLLLYLNFRRVTEKPDRHAVGAVRAGGRPVADVVAGLQPVGGRRRRLHRARRGRGRDRGGHADLSRPRHEGIAGAARRRRAGVHHRRSLRRDHDRRGRARAAQDDDGRGDHGGPAADHVEPRNRRGGDAAHRRADDRRHGVVDVAYADRDSLDLCGGQRLDASCAQLVPAPQKG